MPDILPGVPRVLLPYPEYRGVSQSADIALWEPRDICGQVIADGTGGPFCHATGIVWFDGRIWSAGYEEGHDGSLSQLSAAVRAHSGKISIFRYRDLCPVHAVARHLVVDLGGKYPWTNIRLIAFGHAIAGKLLLRLPLVDGRYRELLKKQARSRTGAICSQHVARSFRRGADVRLADVPEPLISPNDIARCSQLQYIGTLVWPENWSHV